MLPAPWPLAASLSWGQRLVLREIFLPGAREGREGEKELGKGEGEEGRLEGGGILGIVMWRGASFPSSLLPPSLLLYFMLIFTPDQLIADI